jgi:hypothetical protein
MYPLMKVLETRDTETRDTAADRGHATEAFTVETPRGPWPGQVLTRPVGSVR